MPIGQFISVPLPAAVALSGTATLVVVCEEDVIADDMMLQCVIRVVDTPGTTVRGVAYAGQTNTTVVTTQNALNQELLASTTNGETRVMLAIPMTLVNCLAGDRIVVEVGVRSLRAAAAGFFVMHLHDSDELNSAYDLAETAGTPFTTTQAQRLRPWIEFSADLFPTVGTEEFKFEPDGILLNSSPTLPFVDITNIDGLDAAGLRMQSHDREGVHGGYVSSEFETFRTVTVEGNIYASPSSLEAYLDLLKANYAPTRRDRRFFFGTDSGQRFVWGKSQGIRYAKNSQRRLGIVPFQVQIACADPRMYGADQTLSVTSVALNGAFSAFTGAVGNRDALSTLRILGPTGAGLTVTIRNKNGYFIASYAPALVAGDVLMIDFDKRTVTKNFLTNARSDLTVTGPWVSPVEQSTYYRFAHASTAYTAILSWRPAWR